MPRSPGRRIRALSAALLSFLAVACGPGRPRAPEPLPGLPRASSGVILEYAGKLPFRTRLGAAARQILGEQHVVVELEPEQTNFLLSRSQLEAGAVVGRYKKFSEGEIRRFGLGKSDTESYWIVYRKGEDYMGRFVSASMDTSYVIHVTFHEETEEGLGKNMPWAQAIAQFQYLGPDLAGPNRRAAPGAMLMQADGGGTGWATCTPFGCCRTN